MSAFKSVRNNTNFQADIIKDIKNIKFGDKDYLKNYQRIVIEYLKGRHEVEKHTGILLFHEMGFGKTITTHGIIDAFKDRKTLAMMTRSLQDNFSNASKVYNKIANENKELDYDFITINSSTMFKTIMAETRGNLEGYTIIIDEAHDFFNAITNDSITKNAYNLYKLIMSTEDIIVIFLTGQVLVNDPFELVGCFNMLHGYKQAKNDANDNLNKKRITLFPENYEEFRDMFVKDNHLFNKEKYMDRITGYVSYYGQKILANISPDGIVKRENFPDELPMKIIKCEMKDYQYATYALEKIKEQRDNKWQTANPLPMMKPKSVGVSYKPGSRQMSNFAFPNNLLKSKDIYKLTTEQLTTKLHEYSCKFVVLIENLKKNPSYLKLVYTFYVKTGTLLIAKILELNGFERFQTVNKQYEFNKHGKDNIINNIKEEIIGGNNDNNDEEEEFNKIYGYAEDAGINVEEFILNDIDNIMNNKKTKGGKQKKKVDKIADSSKSHTGKLKYAILLAEDTLEVRREIIDTFNSVENAHGELIDIILISKSSAQGTDFKRIREIHIGEPYWNMGLILQIKFRGIRYLSHADLPENERNVQSYLYLATHKDLITTDLELYEKSISKDFIINEFLNCLIEASIDCSFFNKNNEIHCRVCVPNNRELYFDDIDKDINTVSRCSKIEEETIEAEEVIVNDIKYYFTKNPLTIYKHDDRLDKYIELNKLTEEYSQVKDIILASKKS